MDVTCIKCKKVTVVPVELKLVEFACSNCCTLSSYEKNPAGEIIKIYNYIPDTSCGLNIGQQGELFGVAYTVTGMLVKRVAGNYYWQEYILDGPKGERAFLSESNGHWIFLKEEETKLELSGAPLKVDYHGTFFQLYGKEKTTIAYAEGIFDYVLPRKQQTMKEYINPPYIISFEIDENGQTLFVGEHIASGTVKKAFNAKRMPVKVGVGIVQPPVIELGNSIIILAVTALLLIFSHIFIYRDKVQENLLTDTLPISLYANKPYVSKTFEVKEAASTLRIKLNADVNNSWAYVDIGLVNESTGAEEYAGKDLEYYHGYEGGESWHEGSENEEMNLCGVAPGRYHLVFTPQKAPNDGTTTTINIDVTRNPPSKRNVVIPIVFMALLGLGLFYWDRYNETKRWEDSDYSPYNE